MVQRVHCLIKKLQTLRSNDSFESIKKIKWEKSPEMVNYFILSLDEINYLNPNDFLSLLYYAFDLAESFYFSKMKNGINILRKMITKIEIEDKENESSISLIFHKLRLIMSTKDKKKLEISISFSLDLSLIYKNKKKIENKLINNKILSIVLYILKESEFNSLYINSENIELIKILTKNFPKLINFLEIKSVLYFPQILRITLKCIESENDSLNENGIEILNRLTYYCKDRVCYHYNKIMRSILKNYILKKNETIPQIQNFMDQMKLIDTIKFNQYLKKLNEDGNFDDILMKLTILN